MHMRFLYAAAAWTLTAGLALASGDVLHVIVGFKQGIRVDAVTALGGEPGRVIQGANAVAVRLPPRAVAALRAHPMVAYVEEDGIARVAEKGGKGGGKKQPSEPSQPSQSTPWGVTRVGGTRSAPGIKVAIIDTGTDLDHPDLMANIKGDVSFVARKSTGDDDHGHGTHVAGTVAGLDNGIGVVGVTKDASIYAVKVLDRRGFGRWSDIAAGIDWVRLNGMHIANMSLGGGYSSTMDLACQQAADAGVLLVAAAGNSGDGNLATIETSYPASFASVLSVGATDIYNDLASFSNTNSDVQLSAPGVSVSSTWKGGGYKTISGTSMASPHVAGCAAVIWSAQGAAATRGSVEAALQQLAIDLGPTGRDPGFGYGLVQHGR